jgi:hypothetical protein
MAAVKGIFGAPLCLDVSKDTALLAAGYEDDTFLLYSMQYGHNYGLSLVPLCRGQGHKSFVSQIKFDNYLMEYLNNARAKREEEVKAAEKEEQKQVNLDAIKAEGSSTGVNPSQMIGRKISNTQSS